jgi:hypothetical protein
VEIATIPHRDANFHFIYTTSKAGSVAEMVIGSYDGLYVDLFMISLHRKLYAFVYKVYVNKHRKPALWL